MAKFIVLLQKNKYAVHSLSLVAMALSAIGMYLSAQIEARFALIALISVFAIVNGLLLFINQ